MEVLKLSPFKKYLKPRPRQFHKGDAGHVLIVGGDYGFSGAPRLAAEAALRVGAGLVSVATRPEHAFTLNLTRPEIMCHAAHSAENLEAFLPKINVIIVGPGLGVSEWARELVDFIFETKKPLVVDADALNLLAETPQKKSNWILTPHPGEAARLLKKTSNEIQKNRLSALKAIQKNYGGACVLKGAGSLILSNGKPSLCEAGNPGMATAGMGDVLSGVIGGLIAQGVSLSDAAKLGVLLHAMAGDLAAKDNGERGMLALDLMKYLRQLVNSHSPLPE